MALPDLLELACSLVLVVLVFVQRIRSDCTVFLLLENSHKYSISAIA